LDVALPGAAPNGPVSGKRMKAGGTVDFSIPTHGLLGRFPADPDM